ncbi:MAG: hypothetical protein LBR36_07945 [Bacteroidales bacterium]|jgi:hypothetical protein|nr:hypothetical protein [Bacteroidales bacterium]
MLTHKQKFGLLFFGIGFLVGIIVAAIVAYFSVIVHFTKEKIVHIYDILPEEKVATVDTVVIEQQIVKPSTTKNIQQTDTQAVQKEDDIFAKIDTLPKEIIKTDTKVAEILIAVQNISTDSLNTEPVLYKTLKVEQWKNPTNFMGYRLTDKALILYGVDISQITLITVDRKLYLLIADKQIELKKSTEFTHFSF